MKLLLDESMPWPLRWHFPGHEVFTAADMGIAVIGSLRVLAEGNRAGLIEDMPAVVQDILDSGYWIDPEVVETFLGNAKKGGAP